MADQQVLTYPYAYTAEQHAAIRVLAALIPPVAEPDYQVLADQVAAMTRDGKLGDAIGRLLNEQARLEREFHVEEERNQLAAWLVENIASLHSVAEAAELLRTLDAEITDDTIALAEAKAGWDSNP